MRPTVLIRRVAAIGAVGVDFVVDHVASAIKLKVAALKQHILEHLAAPLQDRLYAMMDELGGMNIPLNPPRGRQQMLVKLPAGF